MTEFRLEQQKIKRARLSLCLCAPSAYLTTSHPSHMTETTSIDRRTAIVNDLGPLQETFVVKARDYKLQYAHLYFMRLMLMRPVVLQQAMEKWGNRMNFVTERWSG